MFRVFWHRKPKQRSLGGSFLFSIFILSITVPLKSLPGNRVQQPILPYLRINIWGFNSVLKIICSGCAIFTQILQAKFNKVFSVNALKKLIFKNILIFDSFKNYAFNQGGNLLINCFSSSKPNSFFILSDSSIKLHTFHQSYFAIQLLSANLRIIRKFLVFSWPWVRIFVIKFPTQLILQAKSIQLKVQIIVRQIASLQLEAERSPKPTVSIIVVPQQQAHEQSSYHGAAWAFIFIIQFEVSDRDAIASKATARTWAKPKLTKKTLASDQYCSLQKLLQNTFSIFSIFSKHYLIFNTTQSLTQLVTINLELMSTMSITRHSRSIKNFLLIQFMKISLRGIIFLPSIVLILMKLIIISIVQKHMEKVCKVDIKSGSMNQSKTKASVYTKKSAKICIILKNANERSNQLGICMPGLLKMSQLKFGMYG